jgi:regulator of replication initiation timing
MRGKTMSTRFRDEHVVLMQNSALRNENEWLRARLEMPRSQHDQMLRDRISPEQADEILGRSALVVRPTDAWDS